MRTVPALILSAAALLQFFSGSASAVTCDSVSYLCTASSALVRDPSKNTDVCTSDPTDCDDTDCCMAGTLTCAAADGYLCTTQGNILDVAKAAVVCTNDCDDAQCCTPGSATCSSESHPCTGRGMDLDANKADNICTNGICTDFQCCSVNTRCEHLPACDASTKVLNPLKILEECSTAASAPYCDDDLCCKTTCASANYACASGTRNDDATCASGGCADDECCTTLVQCSVDAHPCPTGYHRVGTNMCTGTGLCTDADCCEADMVSTITPARQKRTPPSRQHLTQYGNN